MSLGLKYYFRLIVASILLSLFFGMPAKSQVLINEFLASNSTNIEDPDFEDYSDWLELYNSGKDSVDLGGFFLTDNIDDTEKWQIPDGTIIPAGGFLLIWTDGNDVDLHTPFRLSADGEVIALISSQKVLLDSVSFGIQKTDVSFGRTSDGGSSWGYFEQPTPDSSNTTQSFSGITYNRPRFSQWGGMYSSSLSVELLNDMGGDIRYTLDGSAPIISSALYSTAFRIDTTTILRARIFKPGMIGGPTVTHSYFINENSADGKLPVFSIATEPENFWDPESGIYTQTYKPLWEVPINIELFENDGSDRAAFNELAGTKVNGLWSWRLPQKMLGIYFRSSYDDGNLEYPITPQRNRRSYKNFALRASGSDWSYTLFRDMLGQNATMYNMDLDVMGFRPAVVFVNGQYLGIHNIREKVDDDYIEKNYMLEPGSFDLIENEDYVEAGDLDAYNHLLSLLKKDLSIDANYEAVAELVDIENYTDYQITELSCGNKSITHNVMAWKPKDHGKWRWVVMDLDRGYFSPDDRLISFYRGKDPLLLKELMANQSFTEYFGRRLAAHSFTTYNPARMKELINKHAIDIEAEVPRHISRWLGRTSDYGDAMPSIEYWHEEVDAVKAYVEARPIYLVNDLQNYGFSAPAILSISINPAEGGMVRVDGLKAPGHVCSGPLPKDIPFQLTAENKPGYSFSGWTGTSSETIVSKGSVWKYLDSGVDPGGDWNKAGFDDSGWSSGNAELGYGDGDENTVLSFGSDSDNKYTTSYFRKSFTATEAQGDASGFEIRILRDDGAVVYLNGTELFRTNMPAGDINYTTFASSNVGSGEEDVFTSYGLDGSTLLTGDNLLAVEIHQRNLTSSDISFDLELSTQVSDNSSIISTDKELTVTLTGDLALVANYVQESNCLIPTEISTDLTLGIECSPYMAAEDVHITENASLTIDPGVEIWMSAGVSIFIEGEINAKGSEGKEILFMLNPEDAGESWGGLIFRNTNSISKLSYVSMVDASGGPNPVTENAAISAFYADLELDHLGIEDVQDNPITARYSDITLTNSKLHSRVTGDLINVKYGNAHIENCIFTGNDQPDTDAIDYDEIENGIIRNCRISDFTGTNSDAIDIGENAANILIDSVVVYHVTDKGVSMGQRSTASIRNSVFVNCNMGIALKDSSWATIDHVLFYANDQAVASYEKNPGYAGGNGRVSNSILSNSSSSSVFVDSKSTLEVSYSLSDNDPLQADMHNVLGNPLFSNPTFFDFACLPGSPVFNAGNDDGTPSDLGTQIPMDGFKPPVVISEIFINAGNLNLPEYIALHNPSNEKVNISGYKFTKGITATIPEGTWIEPGAEFFITSDISNGWRDHMNKVVQWEEGRLANEGENIKLKEPNGITVDYVAYEDNGLWPAEGFTSEGTFKLKDPGLDNHLPENWTTSVYSLILNTPLTRSRDELKVYPNPTSGMVTIQAAGMENRFARIYNLMGQQMGQIQLDAQGTASIDLSRYNSGLLIIKIGTLHKKIIISE